MKVFDYRLRENNNSRKCFSRSIYNSPWVLFHGTTNVFSQLMEEFGFKFDTGLYSKDDVRNVISIFEEMDWPGLGGDAYSALSSYTMGKDFAEGEVKPIFFSEDLHRTIGYTRPLRVGGETAGCLAYSISNLKWFLEESNHREEFRARRYKDVIGSLGGVDLPDHFKRVVPTQATASDCLDLAHYLDSKAGRQCVFPRLLSQTNMDRLSRVFRPWNEDLSWLSTKLEELTPLYARLSEAAEKYDHGVVYAVEFKKTDFPFMKNMNIHGIAYYGQIPPSRILEKVMISPTQKREIFPGNFREQHVIRSGINDFNNP